MGDVASARALLIAAGASAGARIEMLTCLPYAFVPASTQADTQRWQVSSHVPPGESHAGSLAPLLMPTPIAPVSTSSPPWHRSSRGPSLSWMHTGLVVVV